MTIDRQEEKKKLRSGLIFTLVAVSLSLLLIAPVTVVLLMDEGEECKEVDYEEKDGMVSGDMPMDQGSRQLWEDFLSTAPTLEISGQKMDPDIERSELERIYSLPDEITDEKDQWSADPPTASGGREEQATDDDTSLDGAESKSSDREVEESDIVKTVGNRLYVLNRYLGLLAVNLEDPSDPYIEGRVSMVGTPVSMYIFDPLGFVIVSDIPAENGGSNRNSGMLYIIDLTYPSDPRIVMSVDIDGYPIDSRRVGEVIYVISNEQPNYYYQRELDTVDGVAVAVEGVTEDESTYRTHITSIGFHDPEELGPVDSLVLEGNSNKIHASQYAIFIPQQEGSWDAPATGFAYVDISDPEGDIRIRGSVTVDGYLRDRFQMDHYKGMFRVVTQEHPAREMSDRFPSSTLRVIDARDPDDMEEISSLLIDDEGNLMATRFAGERAYTIHLPEAMDPLDVIDLRDPADPRLTDVLEIPGWVEHLEVIGERIIAVGVDNEEEMKVALYLFDVTDPENAVLADRVVVGEGYTYSQANWDEKALTVLTEEELVALPFTSYDRYGYITSVNGLQLISFDLEKGDLEARGSIEGMGRISRSRMVNDNLVATSEYLLQSIDISDLDTPRVQGILELAENHRDAFISDGKLVSVIAPPWGSSGARIKVSEISKPMVELLEIGPEGLEFESVERSGNTVYIKGIRQGEGHPVPLVEVHRYDMSAPLEPVHYKEAAVELSDCCPNYKDYGYYLEDDVVPDAEREVPAEEFRLSYDPTVMTKIDGSRIAVYQSYGYYLDYSGQGDAERLYVIEWTGTEEVRTVPVTIPIGVGIYDIFDGPGKNVFIETYQYPEGYTLMEMEIEGPEATLRSNHTLKGDVIGVSKDGRFAYTTLYYYYSDGYNSSLNVYDISQEEAVFLEGISIDENGYVPIFQDDRIVLTSTNWGSYPVYEDVVVREEKSYPGDGALAEPEPETTVHIIDLDEGLFSSETRVSFNGSYYSSIVLDDLVLMTDGGSIVAVDLQDEGTYRSYEFSSSGWVSGGDLEEDLAVFALGYYGIEVIQL